MQRISALVLLALVLAWSSATTMLAQQPTLDLERDIGLRDAVADARRLEVVTEVSQPEPGTLRLTVGPGFSGASSTNYNLSRLYLAYAQYQRGHRGRIVLELMHQSGKIGEYDRGGLHLTRQPPAPALAPSSAATPAAGKPSARRGGWYTALGVSNGAADFTCERCVFERSSAVSGYVMLGRRITERTVLGVDATGWQKSDETTRGRMYTIGVVAFARFDDNLPLSLSGGIGYAGYRRRMPVGTVAADALGYSARLSVEVRITERLRLAPYLGLAGSFGQPDFTYGDGTAYGLSANFDNLQLGTAVVLD